MAVTYRVPGAVLTEREHRVPLDHAAPDGPSDHGVHPRGRGTRRRGSSVSRVPPGRPGLRGEPPDEPAERLDEARAPAVPRAAARPARDRAGRRRSARSIPGDTPADQAEYLAHFRADAIVRDCEAIRARARLTAVDGARPELRRVHDADLPVVRARGPARGADHRRPDAGRPVRGRRLWRDVRPGGGGAGPLLRAVPRRPGPGPRHPRAPRRGGRAPARRRPADRPPVRAAGHVAR